MSVLNKYEDKFNFIDLTNEDSFKLLEQSIVEIDAVINQSKLTEERIEDLSNTIYYLNAEFLEDVKKQTSELNKIKFKQKYKNRLGEIGDLRRELFRLKQILAIEVKEASHARVRKRKYQQLLTEARGY